MIGFLLKLSPACHNISKVTLRGKGPQLRHVRSPCRLVMTSASTAPTLSACPRVCLHDVPTLIRAEGLREMAPYTLHATVRNDQGKEFFSYGEYYADPYGVIDVRRNKSIGGTYKGIFPAGLFLTLKPSDQRRPYTRLFKTDTTAPWKFRVRLFPDHDLSGSKEPVAEVELERHLMGPGVRRVPIRGERVRGVLYLPPGEGPFPGILDMFGLINGIIEHRSAMFASRGIAALALPYFGYDGLLKNGTRIDMEYFEEAIELLCSQRQIIPDRCGAVGLCVGGVFSLLLGIYQEKVKAVVSMNGQSFLVGSDIYRKGKLFFKAVPMEDIFVFSRDGIGTINPELGGNLVRSDKIEVLPLHEMDDTTHVLAIGGIDDTHLGHLNLKFIQQKMQECNKANFEGRYYEGLGHLVDPPYSCHIDYSYHNYFPGRVEDDSVVCLSFGGDPFLTSKAQEDVWLNLQRFIRNTVQDGSPWYQNYLQKNV